MFTDIFPADVADNLLSNPPFSVQFAASGLSAPSGSGQRLGCSRQQQCRFSDCLCHGWQLQLNHRGRSQLYPAQHLQHQSQHPLPHLRGVQPADSTAGRKPHQLPDRVCGQSWLPRAVGRQRCEYVRVRWRSGIPHAAGVCAGERNQRARPVRITTVWWPRSRTSRRSLTLQLNYTYSHALDEISNGGFLPFGYDSVGKAQHRHNRSVQSRLAELWQCRLRHSPQPQWELSDHRSVLSAGRTC